MARKFAEGTTVQAGSTKGQIEDMLMSRGCDRFGSISDSQSAKIIFGQAGISYLISIDLPDPEDAVFCEYKQGSSTYRRTESQCRERYIAELNRRWRALHAVIKAKLIAVEEGITTFEDEFLSHAVVAGGMTFGEHYVPALKAAALEGGLPQPMALPGRKK